MINMLHSYAGISRSASMVIAYLMQEHQMSLYDALSHTRKRRPIIFPNPGFQKQLFEFDRKLKAARTKKASPSKHSEETLQSTLPAKLLPPSRYQHPI